MDGNNEKYVREVRETDAARTRPVVHEEVVTSEKNVGGAVLASRVISYLVGVIIALLALRVVLLLLAANPDSPFVAFIYRLSNVFAWPFYGIFGYEPSYGSSELELSSIVAIVVYALIGYGLSRLFTLSSNRTDV